MSCEYMTVYINEQLCRSDIQGKTAAVCVCMYSSAVHDHDAEQWYDDGTTSLGSETAVVSADAMKFLS